MALSKAWNASCMIIVGNTRHFILDLLSRGYDYDDQRKPEKSHITEKGR